MEVSTLEIILISTCISFVFLWLISGVWAQTEYLKLSHMCDKESKVQPSTSYFLLRGMVVLYWIIKNPMIELEPKTKYGE
jgi:hypothetical protein